MANVQTLQDKVVKAQEKVEKKKATIVRHEKQLVKKIATLEKKSGRTVDLGNMDVYKWDENDKSYDYYWEACDVERKLDDIKGAKKNLKEAERIAYNWQEKLNDELEKERKINEDAPQVIKDFLEQWKQLAYEWHIKRYNDYQEFKKELEEEERSAKIECLKTTPKYAKYLDEDGEVEKSYRVDMLNFFPRKPMDEFLKERNLDWKSIKERKAVFAGQTVMYMDSIYDDVKRLEWLEKTIEAEKKAKLFDLINRITDITGIIKDATGLRISNSGNLNGIIKGERANVKVETISAGGWNIQCFHYRTLVNKIPA